MRTVYIKNEKDTEKFGLELADQLKPGDVLALVGDLGTGKTTLTKAIARGLGVCGRITSPTFTIVREYDTRRIPLYHFDVYRLESGADLTDIGAEEYFDAGGICVIEWADRVAEVLPDETKVIFIEYGEHESERVYKCTF